MGSTPVEGNRRKQDCPKERLNCDAVPMKALADLGVVPN